MGNRSGTRIISIASQDSILQSCNLYLAHPCDRKDNAGCQHTCNKNGAGFACSCNKGFKLKKDAKTCEISKLHPIELAFLF